MPFLRGAAPLSFIQTPRRASAVVRNLLLTAAVAASALASLAPGAAQAAPPAELKLDYACLALVANWAAGCPEGDAAPEISLPEIFAHLEAATANIPPIISALLA